MDEIVAIIKKLFPVLLMVLLMAPSALFSKKRKEARDKARRKEGASPPVGDSELARRVQRNFEDLMKQRTGKAPVASAEPEAWKPIATIPAPSGAAPPPRAAAKPKASKVRSAPAAAKPRPHQKPRRPARTHEVTLPSDPRHSEAYEISQDAYRVTGKAERDAREAYRVDTASTSRPMGANRARQILLDGRKMGRSELRRAILLKEILDRPVGQRPAQDPIPGA